MIKLFLILVLFIFLIGCSLAEDKMNSNVSKANASDESVNKAVPEQKISLEKNLSQKINLPLETSETNPSGCGGWRCISSFVKAYQYENCSFGKTEKCTTSCVNNTCAPVKTCTSGFKCFSKSESGYQKEDCSWSNYQKCPFGCSNNECSPMPEGYNATNATNASAEPEVQETNLPVPLPPESVVTVYSLKYGEEHQLDGKTFQIYNLEAERVILIFNGIKSNWLKIGDEFKIGNSFIQIKDLSYQPYVGGAQIVDYIVK